ncbi:Ref family recombination enhancement nuclease [Candidatus Sororendozoicomonas aggregata]|uniref:Ref family recombination enhancement nuclease n=1 Tax=Candidatus Sororendozoicomonas aggregata TaxID=3073239 RepID=UPI002ED063F8
MATQEEKNYMHAVARLGCICCRNTLFKATPAQVHHKRKGIGKGQRASHFDTMPLCPDHHLYGSDAVHKNYTAFVARYGTEEALIEQTRREVEQWRSQFVGNGGPL